MMMADAMDQFIESGTAWLCLIGLSSWRALPLVVLVFTLALVLRRKLSPAVYALLWTIVLVRFILPVSVGSPVSLHGSIDAWTRNFSHIVDGGNSPPLAIDPLNSFLPNVDAAEPPSWELQQASLLSAAPRQISMEEIIITSFLLVITLTTVALLLRGFIAHVRFAIGLRSCRLLTDQHLIDMLLRECDSLSVGRRPALREVPGLAAPAVFGLVRHTVCLPTGMVKVLSEEELRWVMRHELAHIRRRDVAVSVLASISSACHWFNPLVWLCSSRLRTAMEAAADRLALTTATQMEAISYGHLLVRLAEASTGSRATPTLGLLPFASGKHLKRRVTLLTQDARPRGLIVRSLAALAVLALAIAGLSDAREIKVRPMPVIHLPKNVSITSTMENIQYEAWNFGREPKDAFSKDYDIDAILETIPNVLKESRTDAESQLMRWLPLPTEIWKVIRIDGRTLTANLNARQHELLEQTLDAWQRGEPRQISIETRFIQTNLRTAGSIDWTGSRIESLAVEGLGPAIAARISESQLKDLILSAQSDKRTNVVYAPRVTCFNAQSVNIADQVQRPFVTGAEPKTEGTLEPVISVINEGLELVLNPQVQPDDKIKLSFQVTGINVKKVSYANLPIRLPHETQPRFTVQVPATERYAISANVDLGVGESVVIAIPCVFNLEPGADSDSTVLVTLTPRLIETK